jgi:hypothetical protein
MAIVIASAHLNDNKFLKAFSECELPPASFRHGDHLRLGWIYLHRHPFPAALKLVRTGIQRYAAHYGVPRLFHNTITTACMWLLSTHDEVTFEEFIGDNEYRLNPGLLDRFWTPATLNSDAARLDWVPPDREALPN